MYAFGVADTGSSIKGNSNNVLRVTVEKCFCQRSGAMRKSRWLSWVPVPNKPMVSVDVKQHFNNDELMLNVLRSQLTY